MPIFSRISESQAFHAPTFRFSINTRMPTSESWESNLGFLPSLFQAWAPSTAQLQSPLLTIHHTRAWVNKLEVQTSKRKESLAMSIRSRAERGENPRRKQFLPSSPVICPLCAFTPERNILQIKFRPVFRGQTLKSDHPSQSYDNFWSHFRKPSISYSDLSLPVRPANADLRILGS